MLPGSMGVPYFVVKIRSWLPSQSFPAAFRSLTVPRETPAECGGGLAQKILKTFTSDATNAEGHVMVIPRENASGCLWATAALNEGEIMFGVMDLGTKIAVIVTITAGLGLGIAAVRWLRANR
jgi:hypothetical protein